MGGAGQHQAEFRRHHMGDALVGVAEVENSDAVAAAAFAHGAQERRAVRIGLVGTARPGRHRVVLARECEVRPPHGAPRLGELAESVRRVEVMKHMPVDIDEIAPVGAARHPMRIPNLVEQRLRHCEFAPRTHDLRGNLATQRNQLLCRAVLKAGQSR